MTDSYPTFPPREAELPVQVHGFLRVCELACSWYDWQDEHYDEDKAWFCEGVIDYWYEEGLEPPRWEQLFYKDLKTGELRREPIPSRDRFAYQQGAMVGYLLRQEYRDETEEAT